MPSPKTIAEIKKDLLKPSLTSQFEVEISPPPGLSQLPAEKQRKLNLLCSEASLPGSNVGTTEINNNFHGVTEKHANRRIFDDRLDLTFYCDAEDYTPIRFFESWIKYITGGSQQSTNFVDRYRNEEKAPWYFYRMRYPQGDKGYMSPQGLIVRKFEKNYSYKILQYEFINSFPLAINSMPVSYDSSDVLKCTVSMSYIRYVVSTVPSDGRATPSSNPFQQALFNSNGLSNLAARVADQAVDRLTGNDLFGDIAGGVAGRVVRNLF